MTTPRPISGAIRLPIVSSRSKKALGTPARPSSSTQTAKTRSTDGTSGDRRPKTGAAAISARVIRAPSAVVIASTVP